MTIVRQAIEIILKQDFKNRCYIKKSVDKWRMKFFNPIEATNEEKKRIKKLSNHILDITFNEGTYSEIVILFNCAPSSIKKLDYKPRKSKML